MPPEKTQIEIPYGVVEYTAFFNEPIFEGWDNPTLQVNVLRALSPYGFNLDGVEYKGESEKASEHAIVFRRTNPATPGMNLTLGLGKAVITAENLDWSEAERFVLTMKTALGAILDTAPASLRSQQVALGMHIQLKSKQRKDVTMPLLSAEGLRILEGNISFPGIVLHVEKGHIVVDASAVFANGLFIRLFREHSPDAPLEMLAEVLRKDEERVFEVLGLEGTL
ncbi:MAG: hypothetical protein ACHQ03_10965 [Candidatus Bathyarchaeia archaeon]